MKRLLCVMLSLTMIFAFIACNGGEDVDVLADEKIAANADLSEFTHGKEKNLYDDEEWLQIEQIVLTAKETIESAKSEEAIESALNAAKEQINSVKIYSDCLDEELFTAVKQDYYDTYEISANLAEYYGVFNGNVLIKTKVNINFFLPKNMLVADMYFYQALSHTNVPVLALYSGGDFFNLSEAYNRELLTENDLHKILYRLKTNNPDAYAATNSNGDTIYMFVQFAEDFDYNNFYLFIGDELPDELFSEYIILKRITTDGFVVTLSQDEYTVDASQYNKEEAGQYVIEFTYDDITAYYTVWVYDAGGLPAE